MTRSPRLHALPPKTRVVEKVCIWTPDKDLAQCVREDRVVQVDRKSKTIRDADGVRKKFGVDPELIPDFLALVGDSADGYPGMSGIGPVGAVTLLKRHGAIENFPPTVLGDRQQQALLLQKACNVEDGCAAVHGCRSAALERPDRRVRVVDGAYASTPVARAVS